MTGSHELVGRIAAVTGAGSGLGAAMSRRFAEAGMAVAALDIDEAAARATASALADELGVPTMAAHVDVGDAESLVAAAAGVAGDSAAATSCAPTSACSSSAPSTASPTTTGMGADFNVLGTVRTVASFLPLLRASDTGSAGSSSRRRRACSLPGCG